MEEREPREGRDAIEGRDGSLGMFGKDGRVGMVMPNNFCGGLTAVDDSSDFRASVLCDSGRVTTVVAVDGSTGAEADCQAVRFTVTL